MEFLRSCLDKITGEEKRQQNEWKERQEKENKEAEKYMEALKNVILLNQRFSTQGLKPQEINDLMKECEFISRFTRVKGGNKTVFNRAYATAELKQAFLVLDQLAIMKDNSGISEAAYQAAAAIGTDYDCVNRDISRKYAENYNKYGLDKSTNTFRRVK